MLTSISMFLAIRRASISTPAWQFSTLPYYMWEQGLRLHGFSFPLRWNGYSKAAIPKIWSNTSLSKNTNEELKPSTFECISKGSDIAIEYVFEINAQPRRYHTSFCSQHQIANISCFGPNIINYGSFHVNYVAQLLLE